MNPSGVALGDLIGVIIGFTFTLFIFSYVWGDNPLFRLTIHIFVGVAAGYAVVVTIFNIILPHLIFPLVGDEPELKILTLFYLLPSALLLTKISPRLSKLGNPAMAFLVGIGAAAAIGGTVFGTISPQVSATINVFDTEENFLNAGIVLVGTLTTLIYFHFGVRKKTNQTSQVSQIIKWISQIGQAFIAFTLGAIFAGVYFSALAALIERISFIWQFITENFIESLLM